MRRVANVLAATAALAACATPRNDRDWTPYLAQEAVVARVGDRFTVQPVSDWTYGPEGPRAQSYGQATYAFEELKRVWFVLEPQPGSRIAAHTLLLFEFEGDRLLGLTVEARREKGERYSAVRGVLPVYELSYVWATARDLLVGRAAHLRHEVFIYPVTLEPAALRFLLSRSLDRTEALRARPRFYNTLFSNCTNELAKAAKLRWSPPFVLTGLSDEHLHRQGLIPGATFAEAKARADATTRIIGLQDLPSQDFDRALLQSLRHEAPAQKGRTAQSD